MTITINDEYLKLHNIRGNTLSIEEVLACLIVIIGKNPNDIVSFLKERGIILEDPDKEGTYYVHSEYRILIQKILLQSDKSVPKPSELSSLVDALQELFPKERKCDANGVPKWSYRGNKRDINERLQKFYSLYGKQWSQEQIIEATRRYVERYKDDKSYMKILQYFIFKTGEGSQLATELEGLDIDDVSNIQRFNYDSSEIVV